MPKVRVCYVMVLLLSAAGQSFSAAAGFVNPQFRWQEGGTIPVCFENPSVGNLFGRKMVEYVIEKSWEQVANINFDFSPVACQTTNQGIMIKITDTDRMECNGKLVPHPGRPGACMAATPDGQAKWVKMHLNFDFEKFKGAMSPATDTATRRQQINRMIFHYAIHEFGHALGFNHEDDRIEGKREAGAFQCSDDDGENSIGGVAVSYYDIHSVMHYLCNQAGNWRYGPPITLSCGDMTTVRWMYGDRNTHIGPDCLKAHATNQRLPSNFKAGYTIPSGGYEIGSGSDEYKLNTKPIYRSAVHLDYSTSHKGPNQDYYRHIGPPKVTLGITPEARIFAGASQQGYRITLTYIDTPGTPSQAWVEELTLSTMAGPLTIYRDVDNPKDNKPIWAYPVRGVNNQEEMTVIQRQVVRNKDLDKVIIMNAGRVGSSVKTWSIWVKKGQDSYRSPQDDYGFLFKPPLPAVNVQSANSNGLYYADMNFTSVNAKITYWDNAWFESINIKGGLPYSPDSVRYYLNKGEIQSATSLVPNPAAPTRLLMVDRKEVTAADYFFVTSNRIPFSSSTLDFGRAYRPAGQITWFDAIVYCNLRSELEGLDKVYSYSNPVYAQQGSSKGKCIGMSNLTADLRKNGYRLPTEAEWMGFYSHPQSGEYYWKADANPNEYAWFGATSFFPKDVGQKIPNEKGIYDLSGNSAEFVWASASGSPETSYTTILKGGAIDQDLSSLGKSSRLSRNKHDNWPSHSFRTVRSIPSPLNSTTLMPISD